MKFNSRLQISTSLRTGSWRVHMKTALAPSKPGILEKSRGGLQKSRKEPMIRESFRRLRRPSPYRVFYTWWILDREAPNATTGSTRTRNVLVALHIAKPLTLFGSTFKQVALALLTRKECRPVQFAGVRPTVTGIGMANTPRNWVGAARMVACATFWKRKRNGSKNSNPKILG